MQRCIAIVVSRVDVGSILAQQIDLGRSIRKVQWRIAKLIRLIGIDTTGEQLAHPYHIAIRGRLNERSVTGLEMGKRKTAQ
jgi:hypothetical protein